MESVKMQTFQGEFLSQSDSKSQKIWKLIAMILGLWQMILFQTLFFSTDKLRLKIKVKRGLFFAAYF